ncbi:Carboxypeptidase regulatory-like domain-containing protein [Granulicella rosea]|uniref:Carboxypeptidase regulatory-like domain-containing protein n=1 Tax=Granulicella rosea TaxID=474952 RepID=A0A239DVT9_9BACT|nr:carboxypeptidase regulatory-like domain-containing protein [Granulicella rosea]SNS35842.1 Carboxypeptidase regulatory-like domain-containing protein [Granulicella rosea]
MSTRQNHNLRFARISLLLLFGFIAWMTGRNVLAQTNYGAIVGTVTDATGANLDGASVALKNIGTNAAQTITAGSGGTFSFLNLNPGLYEVTVTNAGFKASTRSNVEVTIGGTVRVDISLQVGDVTQTVTVEATQAPLQTDSASLGGVVEGRQVLESPLNGRNVNNLLDFVPGVVPGGGTSGNTMANGGSGNFQAGAQTQAIAYGNYQIGGGFSGQSLFFIDGVGSNVPENNVNSLVPTQDAVQEFRVQTNNVSAEYGGFAGGVIQISTKSGTNDIHGSVYEYFRNTALDANGWFFNHNGLARQPLHQNQYGFNIGAPILKNKLFAFFSFERETLSTAGSSTYTLPTAAQVAGNFSGVANIYNPVTGVQYSCNGVLNVICPNLIDPTAAKILALEAPLPNRAGLINNYVASAPITGAQNQFNARLDYNLGKADQLFARYTFWNPHNGNSDPLGTKVGSGPTGNTTTEAVAGDNHVFNQSTIADLRLSWLENYNFQTPLSNGFNQSSINANYGALQAQQVNNHQGLLPNIGVPGYSLGVNLSQLYWLNTVYGVSGSVTKVKGRHTVKVGGIGRQILWTNFGNNQGVGFGTTAAFTQSPVAGVGGGNALASFLLGVPASTGINEVGTWHAVLHSYGFYVTDTWQATSKLTANLGLRWDQPGSYSEVNNLDTVLQTNLPTTLGSVTNPYTGASTPVVGGLAYVASSQYPSRREESQHWKLFSPRVGMNYRLDNKSVVRGGYGVSFLPAEITADSPGNSPINSATTSLNNLPGSTVNTTIANPFPNGILLPSGRTAAALYNQLGQGIGARIPDQPYGYVQQWNFGFERALTSKTSMTISYAGAKGTHLTLSQGYTGTGLNLNQLPDQYDSKGADLLTQVANPLYGKIPAGGVLGGQTIAKGYLLKPFPQYTSVNQVVPRLGSSTYEALQSTFNQRFGHGGLVQIAYTYAKLLSNTENTSSFQDGQGGQGVVQDNTNLHAEKAISMQDLTHNLVINYGVDLPFGKGQKYLGNSGGVVDAVVGGWRVNGITTFHSGLPLPFSTSGNSLSNYFGSGPIRPNVMAGCNKNVGGSQQSRINGWFNKACFTIPADYTFGNERRVDSNLRSSGAANFDFSINKSFKVYERLVGKFSLETFNLFNRTQFAPPDTNLNDGGYGTVTGQLNPPRNLQAALRFSF